MRKHKLPIVMLACFFVLVVYFSINFTLCPANIGNKLGFLLENNYYIPKESNICIFEKTLQSEGSGGGWVYGEDNKNYYANFAFPDVGTDYIVLKKGTEPAGFNKLDIDTWGVRKANEQ